MPQQIMLVTAYNKYSSNSSPLWTSSRIGQPTQNNSFRFTTNLANSDQLRAFSS
ncbi:hypothetical protein F511_47390 [Dorcoceras hygrometricum]|uniref:Uncharacterized protein n=1 Tax=Dorcoceras hygrometricum TaxID=472368 RepID=A0A2Z6ZR38_9LAMI|nr:hypothetical protein F511_47390 [Dorcoceras hygrometricum]